MEVGKVAKQGPFCGCSKSSMSLATGARRVRINGRNSLGSPHGCLFVRRIESHTYFCIRRVPSSETFQSPPCASHEKQSSSKSLTMQRGLPMVSTWNEAQNVVLTVVVHSNQRSFSSGRAPIPLKANLSCCPTYRRVSP